MDFERGLLLLIGVFALILVVCLLSLAFSSWRRRRTSPFTPAFRSAHVQPTQKAAPTVGQVRRSANPTREWERQTNHGMY